MARSSTTRYNKKLSRTRSANTIRTLLQGLRGQSWFPTLYQALPLAGRTGTLYARFLGTAAEGKMRAKTGSVDGVRALSGYVTTRGGRDVVFSILVNGDTGSVTNPAIVNGMVYVASYEGVFAFGLQG